MGPTPEGVPVRIRSPGSSVTMVLAGVGERGREGRGTTHLMYAMRAGTLDRISDVLPFCRTESSTWKGGSARRVLLVGRSDHKRTTNLKPQFQILRSWRRPQITERAKGVITLGPEPWETRCLCLCLRACEGGPGNLEDTHQGQDRITSYSKRTVWERIPSSTAVGVGALCRKHLHKNPLHSSRNSPSHELTNVLRHAHDTHVLSFPARSCPTHYLPSLLVNN